MGNISIVQKLQDWINLSNEQIDQIKEIQRKKGVSFAYAAVLGQFLTQSDYVEFFAKHLELPTVEPLFFDIPQSVLKKVPTQLQIKYNCIPFHVKDKYLFLAVADPEDIVAVDDIRFCSGLEPIVHLAPPESIENAIQRIKGQGDDQGASLDEVFADISEQETSVNISETTVDSASLSEDASQAPVIKMVNLIILNALKKKASDIHIEIYENQFRVRYRLDGVLQELMHPPFRLRWAIVSRIKVMAQLDIAEKRLPQDGRIKVRTPGGSEAEFRVSILPTLFGEKVVLRYLDKSALELDMSNLGMEEQILQSIQRSILKPYGMFLVTGPTGSGKTTTLYSALLELNKQEVNILTAEDPIEYSLPGINQVQIKESIGLSFASALRSFLRQDPDIILVGEIRDIETAQMAVKAALTGHLVLSTLHTNDAPSTLTRLLNMGVEPFLLGSAVNAALAQRLARKLCPFCKRKIFVKGQVLKELGMQEEEIEEAEIYESVGCAKCNGTGYSGRTGIFENLIITPEIQELILHEGTVLDLKNTANAQGMQTLRQSALSKLKKGIISMQEVLRITADA